MKLKHWQGYGIINARRIENKTNPDGTKTLRIAVTGSHEYGLVRDDEYDVFRWLVRRFTRDCPDYRAITKLDTSETDGGTYAEYAVTYRPGATT